MTKKSKHFSKPGFGDDRIYEAVPGWFCPNVGRDDFHNIDPARMTTLNGMTSFHGMEYSVYKNATVSPTGILKSWSDRVDIHFYNEGCVKESLAAVNMELARDIAKHYKNDVATFALGLECETYSDIGRAYESRIAMLHMSSVYHWLWLGGYVGFLQLAYMHRCLPDFSWESSIFRATELILKHAPRKTLAEEG